MKTKREPTLFQVHHHAPRSVQYYGELTIVCRPGEYEAPTLRITFQSNGDTPATWYGMRHALEASPRWADEIAEGAELLRRFAKAMHGVDAITPATVCAALETFATEGAFSEVEGRNVPLADLPSPGTMVWMDRGADLDRPDYCTVHVEADSEEQAQARVLKALGAKYPQRIVTWHQSGRRVEHIKTQPTAPIPWRVLFASAVAVAV